MSKSHAAKYFLNAVTLKDINKSMISFITDFVNLICLFVDHQTFLLHISYHVYLYRIIYTWIFNLIFHIWRLLFEFVLIKDILQIEDRKWF